MKPKNRGFTLAEMLVAIIIGFIIVVLTYMTFHTVTTVAARAEADFSSEQRMMRFLADFSRQLSIGSFEGKEKKFESEVIVFETREPVPKTITYEVFNDETGGKSLRCTEHLQLFETEFSYTVLSNWDDISFSYTSGSDWVDSWDKEEPPCAVRILLLKAGRRIEWPVVISTPVKSSDRTSTE